MKVSIDASNPAACMAASVFFASLAELSEGVTVVKGPAAKKIISETVVEEIVSEAPVVEAPTKRKRRSKEQIAIDKAAADAAKVEANTDNRTTDTSTANAGVEVTKTDVRALINELDKKHRSALKDKLTELGAPNVTKLEDSKCPELHAFLTELIASDKA